MIPNLKEVGTEQYIKEVNWEHLEMKHMRRLRRCLSFLSGCCRLGRRRLNQAPWCFSDINVVAF